MEWFVRWFIRSALVWFGLGVTLGLCMAAHPAWIIYRPAHVHMNLVGFVTMMIAWNIALDLKYRLIETCNRADL